MDHCLQGGGGLKGVEIESTVGRQRVGPLTHKFGPLSAGGGGRTQRGRDIEYSGKTESRSTHPQVWTTVCRGGGLKGVEIESTVGRQRVGPLTHKFGPLSAGGGGDSKG